MAERKYETTFIIDPDVDEAGCEERVGRYSDVIARNGGEIIAVERWGTRKLAYRIRHKPQGYYVHIKFKGEAKVPTALEAAYRVDESVMRFLTVLEPKPWRTFPPLPESMKAAEAQVADASEDIDEPKVAADSLEESEEQ